MSGFTAGNFLRMLSVAALGCLLLLAKAPRLQVMAARQPFVADLVLTSGTTFLTSTLFGTGLTLGISAITCGLLLSVFLPKSG